MLFQKQITGICMMSAVSDDASGYVRNYPGTTVSDEIMIVNALQPYGDYVGAMYLQEAIAKPDSVIDYSNLRNLFNPFQKELVDEDLEVQRPVFEFVYSLPPDYLNDYEILDETAIAQYKKRLARIAEEIAQRQWYHDYAVVEDLIAERDFILAELHKALNRHGRSRALVSQRLKDRQTVVKSIKLIVKKLRELDPELGRICDRHIVLTGGVCWRSDPIRE
jgi:hypothetical protein